LAPIAVVTALIFSSTGAPASWARYSDTDLIAQSDLIVVGTDTKSAKFVDPGNGASRMVGEIEIETILKGQPAKRSIRLKIRQPSARVLATGITHKIGQKGLWYLRLLKLEKGEIYAADHPQRFVPMAEAGPQIEMVHKFFDR
jgi:hypothetical protein